MIRYLLLIFVFSSGLFVNAQNGVTRYPVPATYTRTQYSLKNGMGIDHRKNKWVCFNYMGLGMFDGTNWTIYDPSNSGLPALKTNCIAFDSNDHAWIGTDSGAVCFDGLNWIRYTSATSGLLSNTVISVTVSGSSVYLGTNKGLSVWNGTTWNSYTRATSGLICDTVTAITLEPGGALWVGTQKGVSGLQSSVWTSFTTANSALKENSINCIYVDGNNDKWIGTTANAYKLSGTVITSVNDLMSNLASPNLRGAHTICGGNKGGIAYGSVSSGGQAMIETGTLKNYLYHISAPEFMCYESSTHTFWYTTFRIDSLYGGLTSFVDTLYSAAWQGVNLDNMQNLDVNEVVAPILDRGDMHWDVVSSRAGYEVPKGSGKYTDFAASLWIGGVDDLGHLHEAAMTYRQTGFDYWPGPLDTIAGTTDSAKAGAYDRVWKVDRFKISEFQLNFSGGNVQNGTYIPQEGITSWPARGNGNFSRNLAPFVDVNHNGIYDPLTGGDYPVIQGDQEIYRIFNDQLTTHTETGGTAMQVEVHATAYAYSCPAIADSDKVLNYTTFYHYDVFNRSANNYTKVYLGDWQDVDLGYYNDDFVGCHPRGNFGYVYNGALCDGTGAPGQYGCNPPMMSTVVLNGPPAVPGDGIDNNNNGVVDEPGELNLMTGFHYYNNDFTLTGNPGFLGSPSAGGQRPGDYYNYLIGKWKDSTQITFGGNGYGGVTPTPFMYSGNPYDTTTWSEMSVHNTPGDRRFLISCGPFDFNAGAMVSFDYALVFTRDTTLAPQSMAFFRKNANDVAKVQNWWNSNNAPSCIAMNVGIQEVTPEHATLEVYPNPFSDQLTISYGGTAETYSVAVFDLTGKEVIPLQRLTPGVHELNMGPLAEGMYFLQVRDGKNVLSKKVIKR